MIPAIGLGELGPLLVLVGIGIAFVLLSEVAFFTVLLDRPQLPTRRRAAILASALTVLLAVSALALPYEGADGRRCPRAIAEYGFSTAALKDWSSAADPCAVAGQMLVLFGWAAPVMLAIVIGIGWWAGDS